jgi:8-oxo-dGTP pyrophosphatase MutT (NUDIX family)
MRAISIEKLRIKLASRTAVRLREAGTRRAAVLVTLVGGDDDLRLLCFERTHEVMEHKGEICFPGGSIEPHDADAVQAALREAHEEMGVPPSLVEVLGTLDDVHTAVSNYVITPVVGHLDRMPQLVLDPLEVARPVIPSVEELRRPGVAGVEWREWRGTRREIYYYRVEGGRIWGATGRILHNLLALWFEEAAVS